MKVIKKRLMSILLALAVFSVSLSGIGATATTSVAAEKKTSMFDNPALIQELEKNHEEFEKNYENQAYTEFRVKQSLHGISKDQFSKNAIEVANKLIANGFDAYIVGGGTRDFIMGQDSDDFDLVTNATLEDQGKIFGDSLNTHPGAEGRVFGYINYPEEKIDLATYQNIPKAFDGQPGVPPFDPTSLVSDKLIDDSFQRDFSMNAIYYDMKTDELVDFHDGIYGIWKGIISPVYKASIAFQYNPEAIPRALRFKAKYGYTFSEELETTLMAKGEEYVRNIDAYQKMNQTNRMWGKGYSYKCFDALCKYKVLDEFFAPIKSVFGADYITTVGNLIKYYEAMSAEENEEAVDVQMYVACILWPVVKRGIDVDKKSFEQSVQEVVEELEEGFTLKPYMHDNLINDFGKLAKDAGIVSEDYDGRMTNIIYVKEKDITKKAITIKVSAKTLKKKSVSFTVLQKGYGKLSFTNKTLRKTLKSKITFKGTKVTLKKKASKGIYKFIITSAEDDNYKKTKSKTVTVKVA